MMPQKKNPDSLELIRGKTGRIFGNVGLSSYRRTAILIVSVDVWFHDVSEGASIHLQQGLARG